MQTYPDLVLGILIGSDSELYACVRGLAILGDGGKSGARDVD